MRLASDENDAAEAPGPRGSAFLGRAAIALVALAFLCRAVSICVPVFNWDEYIFALVARDILHGALPPTGVFDDKPVGLDYVFAFAEWAGGQTIMAVRAVGFCSCAATAWLLYRSVRSLQLPAAMGGASAALFLFLALHYDGWASMSELLICPLLALVNGWSLAQRWQKRRFLLAFGAVFGIAFQINYLILLCLAFMAPAILLLPGGARGAAAVARNAMLMALGFTVPVLLIWSPQILTGHWQAFLVLQQHFAAHYRAPFPGLLRWGLFLVHLSNLIWAVVLGALLLRLKLMRGFPAGSAPLLLVGLEFLAALLAAMASNKMYPHYFILALPAAILLGAMMFAGSTARCARAGTIFFLLFSAVLAVSSLAFLQRQMGPPQPWETPFDLAGYGGSNFETQAAGMVDQHSAPGQSIFILNETPVIYYLARRPACSQYILPIHYIQGPPGEVVMIEPRQLLEQVIAKRPALVLVGTLYPLQLDAAAILQAAGYREIQQFNAYGRQLRFYAPAGAS